MRQKGIKVFEYYFKISRIWRKAGIKCEEKKIKFGSSGEFLQICLDNRERKDYEVKYKEY